MQQPYNLARGTDLDMARDQLARLSVKVERLDDHLDNDLQNFHREFTELKHLYQNLKEKTDVLEEQFEVLDNELQNVHNEFSMFKQMSQEKMNCLEERIDNRSRDCMDVSTALWQECCKMRKTYNNVLTVFSSCMTLLALVVAYAAANWAS